MHRQSPLNGGTATARKRARKSTSRRGCLEQMQTQNEVHTMKTNSRLTNGGATHEPTTCHRYPQNVDIKGAKNKHKAQKTSKEREGTTQTMLNKNRVRTYGPTYPQTMRALVTLVGLIGKN